MFASFRKYFLLCTTALLLLAGCDDEKTVHDSVREVHQATLDGEGGAGGAGNCKANEDTGRLCDADGDPCTVDRCQNNGQCVYEGPFNCDANAGNSCITDVCTPMVGCEEVINNNASCDGEGPDPCKTGDTCDASGNCLDGTGDLDCNANANNSCKNDICTPGVGCDETINDGATCEGEGPSDCLTGDICDAAGICQDGSTELVCNANAGNSCITDGCDPNSGCIETINNGASCEGEGPSACLTGDICDAAGVCQDGATDLDCSANAGNSCITDGCDANTGCTETINNGAPCEGEGPSACFTGDTCDAGGVCRDGASPLSCTANAADPCLEDICDASIGCTTQNTTLPCDYDGFDCTENDVCAGGVCTQGTPNNSRCADPNPDNCLQVQCDRTLGCQEDVPFSTQSPDPNSSYCNDNIDCTVSEYCVSGTCVGRVDLVDDHCEDTPCVVRECVVGTGCVSNFDFLAGEICRPESAGNEACDVVERCPLQGQPGFGTCPQDGFEPAGTPCGDAACASGLQTDATACTGSNAVCPPANTVSCPGYACTMATTPVCQFECTSDDQCLGTHYCDTSQGTPGTCEERLTAGVSCEDDTPCQQGDRCVDGVCCNSECGGQCQACDVPGFEGQCTPVVGAPHEGGPSGAQRRLCDGDEEACRGQCDGTNVSACVYPAQGTECLAPGCENGAAYEQPTCDGDGACVRPPARDCSPLTCDGDVCRDGCTQDSHCSSNQQCDAGVCVDHFAIGTQCTAGSECESGLCIDGVCCESSCSGQCEACNVAGSRGRCVPVEGEPVGTRPECGGSDDCQGACDGSDRTRCSFPSTETQCGDAACDDASSEATVAAYCNGAGSCAELSPIECPDGCDGDLCEGAICVVDADCQTNGGADVCRAGLCFPPDEIGTICARDADCESGNCVDGVCCNEACDGQCEACDVEDNVGECTVVEDGGQPHGARQPCASDGTRCGGSCDGSSRDACSYPDSGVCRGASCSDGEATVEATCNGTGVCPALLRQDCLTFGCDSADEVCDGDCADGSSCGSGQYCSAGICVDERDDGESCLSDEQCGNGNCVDGFCCNSACDAQCAACDIAGFEGICSAVTGAPHGARPGCEGASGVCGATCDGETVTSCAYPDGTACGDSTCGQGVFTDERTCDGEGRCTAGEITRCATLECNEDGECETGCTENAQCPLNEICLSDGTCGEDPLINAVDKGSCGCRVPGGEPKERGGKTPWLLITPLFVWLARRRRYATIRTSSLR